MAAGRWFPLNRNVNSDPNSGHSSNGHKFQAMRRRASGCSRWLTEEARHLWHEFAPALAAAFLKTRSHILGTPLGQPNYARRPPPGDFTFEISPTRGA